MLKDGTQKQLSLIDTYQEVANVAMGQAADLLARLLDVFVVLPIPKVNELEYSELQMLLTDTARDENVSVICQGFIGFGIAGEALLLFNDSSVDDIAQLMRYDSKSADTFELELLMDISSILIGACLNGIAQQLDIQFSQGHPVVLGQHVNVRDLLKSEQQPWNKTLAIEINYAIEGRNINCDLLILFTEDSLPDLAKRASYLLES
ncbi:MAG TPA: histidine kinase [Aeromonadales bacterium]|nr:histidine kinase [Aeromonadales bacterium]